MENGKSLTIISDCCYSGNWTKACNIQKNIRYPENFSVISSCNEN